MIGVFTDSMHRELRFSILIQFLFSGPIFRMIIGILNMLKYVLDEV